jgi:hypothetical protein
MAAQWNVSPAYGLATARVTPAPVPAAVARVPVDLLIGDIIIQNNFHAYMWVGDTGGVAEREVVHNVENSVFNGIQRAWSMESLLRAVKASIREERLARKKGSTCSSFVTYCYQAAAISQRMGELAIPPHVLNLLKGDRTGCVKLKESAPDVITFFQALFQENKIPFPKGIRVDAKTTYVKLLQKDLQQPDSCLEVISVL